MTRALAAVVIPAVLVLVAGCRLVGPGQPGFPWDYRGFALVTTRTDLDPTVPHPGVLVVLANDEGVEGVRRAGPHDPGSVLVAVGYEGVRRADADDTAVTIGERRTVWTMRRVAAPRGDDSGWRFGAHAGETLKRLPADGCAGCHARAVETDHVFSRWAE